jgi:hypothetical protein
MPRLISPWRTLIAVAAGLYGVFIARSGFRLDGQTFFSLADDPMVSMRYARNLASGGGLVWNPGLQPVEGYTNFLWTVWMALIHLLPVSESKLSAWVMVSGAGLLVANLLLVRAIAVHLAPKVSGVHVLAGLLTALYYPLIFWTLRGMEVGLLAVFMSASILLALRVLAAPSRRDLALLGITLAAGILTRDDFALFGLIVAGSVIWRIGAGRRRKAALLAIGLPLATVVAHEGFRLAYYGDLLPNTYYLKVAGVGLAMRLERGLASLASAGLIQLYAPVVLGAAGVFWRRRSFGAWLIVTTFLGQCAYSVVVGGDSYELEMTNRFITPAVPGLLVLAALGLEGVFARASTPSRPALAGVAVAFAIGAAAVLCSLIGDPVTDRLSEWLLAPVRGDAILAALLALLALLCLMRLVPLGAWAGSQIPARLGRAVLGVAATAVLLATASGPQLWAWINHNAPYLGFERRLVKYGLTLRRATAPHDSIAVTAAGAIPYFSHRRSIDLLGKSDPAIARGPSRSAGLWPGHTKWNYRHSVGDLRPDLLAAVWGLRPADQRLLTRLRYNRLPNGDDLRVIGAVYVRYGASGVDWRLLNRLVPRIFPRRS